MTKNRVSNAEEPVLDDNLTIILYGADHPV